MRRDVVKLKEAQKMREFIRRGFGGKNGYVDYGKIFY